MAASSQEARAGVLRVTSVRGQNLATGATGAQGVFVKVQFGSKHVVSHLATADNGSVKFVGLEGCALHWDAKSGVPALEFTVYKMDDDNKTRHFIGHGRLNPSPRLIGKEQRVLLATRGGSEARLLSSFETLGYILFVVDYEYDQRDIRVEAFSTEAAHSRASPPPPLQRINLTAGSGSGGHPNESSHRPSAQHTAAPSPSMPEGRTTRGPSVASGADDGGTTKSSKASTPEPVPMSVDRRQSSMVALQRSDTAGPEMRSNAASSEAMRSAPILPPPAAAAPPASDRSLAAAGPPSPPPPTSTKDQKQQQQQQQPSSPPPPLPTAESVPDSPLPNPLSSTPRRKLHVEARFASNLIARDMGIPGDPYVVFIGLTVDGDSIDLGQTEVRWTTNEPVWNQKFDWDLDPRIKAIEVMLFDFDDDGESDFLGRNVLDIDFSKSSSKNTYVVTLLPREHGDAADDDHALLRKERRKDFGELTLGYSLDHCGAPAPMTNAEFAAKTAQASKDFELTMRSELSRSAYRGAGGSRRRNREVWSGLNTPTLHDGAGGSEIAQGDSSFRARLKATVLSITGLPPETLAYVSMAFGGGGKGHTTRQCVDNAFAPAHVGASGACVMTYTADFVSDTQAEPLVIEVRDARRDRTIAMATQRIHLRELVHPVTVTAQLQLPDDARAPPSMPTSPDRSHRRSQQHQPAPTITATLLLAAEILPSNIPSKLDRHSILQFCVKKLTGLVPPSLAHLPKEERPNSVAFVRVTYVINEIEHEFTSPAVTSASGPGGDLLFYFEPPHVELGDQPDLTAAAYVVDSNGFDECVGVTHIPFARLTSSPDITVPLLPRASASPSNGKASFSGHTQISGFMSVSSRILPPRAAVKSTSEAQLAVTAPTVVEVAVQRIHGLPRGIGSGQAIVQVVNTSNPTTTQFLATAPRRVDDAVWDEDEDSDAQPLRFDSVGVPEAVKLSVWDSSSKLGATFLGEYTCYLQIPGEPVLGQVITVPLRPRQDPHFHAADVELMNENVDGLGTIQFVVRTFSVKEHEERTRQAVAAAGGGFMLYLQVSEVSDTGKRAAYSVKAEVGGQTASTQSETSACPKFRYNMRFPLHYQTEMLVLHLQEQFASVGAAATVAEVSLPVQAPADGQLSSDTQSSWLVMRRTAAGAGGSSSSTLAPKIQLRWRTVARAELDESAAGLLTGTRQSNSAGGQQHHHHAITPAAKGGVGARAVAAAAGPLPPTCATPVPSGANNPAAGGASARRRLSASHHHHSYQQQSQQPQQQQPADNYGRRRNATPHTPPRTPNPDDDDVEALRNEISALRLQMTQLKPSGDLDAKPFSVSIYVPSHAALLTFDGTTRSTVADALDFVGVRLGITHGQQRSASLVRPNMMLERHTVLSEALRDGETVFFVIDNQPSGGGPGDGDEYASVDPYPRRQNPRAPTPPEQQRHGQAHQHAAGSTSSRPTMLPRQNASASTAGAGAHHEQHPSDEMRHVNRSPAPYAAPRSTPPPAQHRDAAYTGQSHHHQPSHHQQHHRSSNEDFLRGGDALGARPTQHFSAPAPSQPSPRVHPLINRAAPGGLGQASPRAASASPRLPPSVAIVLNRLRELEVTPSPGGRSDSGSAAPSVASVFVKLGGVDMRSPIIDVAVQYIRGHDVNGFVRPVVDAAGCVTGDSEVLLQGKHKVLVTVLEGMSERARAWRFRATNFDFQAEFVEGYIPVLQLGFRVIPDPQEAPNAFEIAATDGGNSEVWFYFSDNYPYGSPHIRWIDERAV